MSTHALTTEDRGAFRNARRVNQALTARMEKRALTWMAERAPQWVTSDQLTLLGLGAQIAAGICYALTRWDRRALLLAIVCMALNWLGDSLDGTLARVRRQERPRYGFYVDHIVDTFGALALIAGLGFSGYLHWQIAAGLLICFYALSIECYLATYTMGRFDLSRGIFGPTEIRVLLAVGNAFLTLHPYSQIAGRRFLLFDVGGAVAIVGMLSMAVSAAFRHGVALYREETLS